MSALLIYLVNQTSVLGTWVSMTGPSVGPMLQTFRHEEISNVASFLSSQKWIDASLNLDACVTGKGFIQAEEWQQKTLAASSQAFVAMWFHDDTEDAWSNGLQKGISAAGYDALRINAKEHVNKICDEIIAEIRRSRFIVADYTGHRGGVYYEAGYAAGRGVPVIPTCRKDEIEKLHFDVRQYNCIDWQNPAELAERLQARISAVLGDGPRK